MTYSVSVGDKEMAFTCSCGWYGEERDIEEWDIQSDRDRVVRVCPGCSDPVPQWGTFRPIEGVRPLAGGDLKAALQATQ